MAFVHEITIHSFILTTNRSLTLFRKKEPFGLLLRDFSTAGCLPVTKLTASKYSRVHAKNSSFRRFPDYSSAVGEWTAWFIEADVAAC